MAWCVTGATMWANLHLLFWLSLVPFATAWLGESHGAPWPTALYDAILLMAALAYLVLQRTIVSSHGHAVGAVFGRDLKGKLSAAAYTLAIGLAFVRPWLSDVLYVTVALMWLVPDRRVERVAEA